MPIRPGAVLCGLVLALAGCTAGPGARPSPAAAGPASLPPATTPSVAAPSTNPPMAPYAPTSTARPPTDAPGAPTIGPGDLSHALTPRDTGGRLAGYRLECDSIQDQCLEAPERGCDRWFGRLSRHAQKWQTWTVNGPQTNVDALVYPTPEGREVTATLVAAAPAVLDWLGTDPLGRCDGFQIAVAGGGYDAIMAYAAPLTGSRPLGTGSYAYVVWEAGGAPEGARLPHVTKEVRFGPYLLQIRFPLDEGRRIEAQAVADLDTITARAYAQARDTLVR